MVYFLLSVLVLAIGLLIISKIPPVGVEIDSPIKALLGGAIIGAFDGIWSLFPQTFRTGLGIISLGLVPLLGAIIVFGLSAWLVDGFRLRWGIWSAIMGAIALAIVSSLLKVILRAVGVPV
ncbi:MAG: phage holin family protein [Leptolyngbya sp. LCM1.Bin17]|nr:MAG: phage holin family protein [Leptolyngbya sp. LCM1.Bin17]